MCLDSLEKYQLCYLKNCYAYFTTQSLELQTGHRWNERPHQKVSGVPYNYLPLVDKDSWELVRVRFKVNRHDTTTDPSSVEDNYSVQDINLELKRPWVILKNPKTEECVEVYAGTSLFAFIKLVKEHQGSVLLPEEFSLLPIPITA